MTHVLIAVFIFHSATGITSNTIREEFVSQVECESARSQITEGVWALKGTLGREIIAQCVEKKTSGT